MTAQKHKYDIGLLGEDCVYGTIELTDEEYWTAIRVLNPQNWQDVSTTGGFYPSTHLMPSDGSYRIYSTPHPDGIFNPEDPVWDI